MKIELELNEEELQEFLDILNDIAYNSGMDSPLLENIIGQLNNNENRT